MHIAIATCTYIYIHTHIHTYSYIVHIYTYIHIYIHIATQYIYIHTYTYTYIQLHSTYTHTQLATYNIMIDNNPYHAQLHIAKSASIAIAMYSYRYMAIYGYIWLYMAIYVASQLARQLHVAVTQLYLSRPRVLYSSRWASSRLRRLTLIFCRAGCSFRLRIISWRLMRRTACILREAVDLRRWLSYNNPACV